MRGGDHLYYAVLDEAVTIHLKRTGMTQNDLAVEMGMSPNTFSWKRRGIREFSFSEAEKLCGIVGITLDEAVGRDRKAS